MRYLIPLLFAPSLLLADPPTIKAIKASSSGSGWRFDVTLAHPDTGWDHYADGWRIELEDGTVLGTRDLLHPHETEQPFTRSLSSVQVPVGVIRVYVRARCNVDGWSGDAITHDLR